MKKKIIILVIILILIGAGVYFSHLYFKKAPERLEKTIENRVIKAMNQIQNVARAIYEENRNYSKVSCLHPELISICEELKLWLGKEPIIHSSSEAYCSYTGLQPGEYYCIDSTGFADKITVNPGQENYCDGTTFTCTKKEAEKPEEPYIKVISPNGGEKWIIGNSYEIKWECSKKYSRKWSQLGIDIRLLGKEGSLFKIASISSKEGINQYNWIIPSTVEPGMDSFKIKIETPDHEFEDVSDEYFSIISCEYRKGEYEQRVYDSQGRVTGLIKGEVKQEIPNSIYRKGEITIYFPEDYYEYEFFCIEGGNYQFEELSIKGGEVITFKAINIPIFPGMTHRYRINWKALREGKNGADLLIDNDGDGIFEKTIVIEGTEFTCEEFLSDH